MHAEKNIKTNSHSSSFQGSGWNSVFFQPKLNVGTPNDKFEVEADKVADQVMERTQNQDTFLNTPSASPFFPSAQTSVVQTSKVEEFPEQEEISEKPLGESVSPVFQSVADDETGAELVQEKCTDCEEEEERVQAKQESQDVVKPSIENNLKNNRGGGNKMDAKTMAQMERGFGADISAVNIHTGSHAKQMSNELGAQAFTHGNNIYFNKGKYEPGSKVRKLLFAHELTHLVQQNSENKLRRKTNPDEAVKERDIVPTFFERGIIKQNTRHNANCNGVTVEGHTDANYGNSFTAPGASTPVSDCNDCSSDECVVNRGTVISVFITNPQITLPSVPSGLSECEQIAVQRFIDTTLKAHERQHVTAFNTYRGRVRTPYTYRGCASGLDAYLQQIHDRIEAPRKANSDAASAALDAGGANIFTVNCDCPDPELDSHGN